MKIKEIQQKIEVFRQKVGGNIYIFLNSLILGLNGGLFILVGIYSLARFRFKEGILTICLGLITLIVARLFFLLFTWIFKKLK